MFSVFPFKGKPCVVWNFEHNPHPHTNFLKFEQLLFTAAKATHLIEHM